MSVEYKTNCPICGCHGVRQYSTDEYGYSQSVCDVCEGCNDLHDLAVRMKIPAYLVELYLDGLRKESELVDVLRDKLAENKLIPLIDVDRLAEEMVEEIYDEVKVEAETELQEGLEEYREKLDAFRGCY